MLKDVIQSLIRSPTSFFFSLALLVPPILIGFSSERLLWDETYHIGLLQRLYQQGFSQTFLKEMNVAMGPLYTIILYLMCLVKGGILPLKILRVVTWIFFVATVLVMSRISVKEHLKREDSVLLFMSLPIFSLMSVFAMSDVPVVFFFCLSLWLAQRAGEHISNFWISHFYGFFSGLMFGLCVVGRQPYLVALVGFAWLAVKSREYRKLSFTFLLAATPLPLMLFTTWGGMTPPLIAAFEAEKSHLSLTHLILSVSQSAISYYFLFPKQILRKFQYALIVVLIFVFLTPWIDRFVVAELSERLPVRFFFQRILGGWHHQVARYVLVSTFALGAFWVGQLLYRFIHSKNSIEQALLAGGVALAVHPLFIAHNYSSRYILGGVLVLSILETRSEVCSIGWKWPRFILGYGIAMAVAAIYLDLAI